LSTPPTQPSSGINIGGSVTSSTTTVTTSTSQKTATPNVTSSNRSASKSVDDNYEEYSIGLHNEAPMLSRTRETNKRQFNDDDEAGTKT
jgi:hypothetical protein